MMTVNPTSTKTRIPNAPTFSKKSVIENYFLTRKMYSECWWLKKVNTELSKNKSNKQKHDNILRKGKNGDNLTNFILTKLNAWKTPNRNMVKLYTSLYHNVQQTFVPLDKKRLDQRQQVPCVQLKVSFSSLFSAIAVLKEKRVQALSELIHTRSGSPEDT